MGNVRSQEQQQRSASSRSLCLLYLIRRSWRMVSLPGKKAADDTDDCATDLSTTSRCSGCKGCTYHQELNFDSESDMAPNAEEDLLMTMPRGGGLHTPKERLRPPTYNAEDYAIALRRWGRRALSVTVAQSDGCNQGTLPSSCTSSSSGYASGNAGEMTLRQFTSVSELLNKLRADLRLAFPSFVQEFASPPAEGISLLLETLRGVQLSQSQPAGTAQNPRRPRARRAALDELGCVECLAACADRCPDAARILAQAQPGLLALAVCLTSSLNRSRVLALQLLTKVCQTPMGHGAVSEAVSTLRLRYGEGGRFRFLAGALLAAKAALPLRLAGLSFLNAFLSTAPRAQTKLYIQAEACEAGLEPRALQEWLRHIDDEDPLGELLREEVRKWSRHCVDVEALQNRARRAEETCRALGKRVAALQLQLQKLQLERNNEYNSRQQQQQQLATACVVDGSRTSTVANEKKVSSSAEDEGISFSERSSSPEERPRHRARPIDDVDDDGGRSSIDNDQETTIDDVIEELRIIVKDAEEELHDWDQLHKTESRAAPSKARECLRSSEESARLDRRCKSSGSLKIAVPGPRHTEEDEEEERESVIVPAIIHPQPPRRAPPFLAPGQPPLVPAGPTEESLLLLLLEDDASDSLLSASRLNRTRQLETIDTPADFEISETVLDERVARAPTGNSLGSRQYSKCANNAQRRTERRRYLRRCQSQDHIEHEAEQHEDGKSARAARVVEHIRKFESMNSFEDSRLRRSESFHQTRLSASEAARRQQQMTKSLDRVDEGLGRDEQLLPDERSYTSFLETGRRQRRDDSRIFAGRQLDVLGIAKNRFNAGRYSGSSPTQQQYKMASQQQQHRHLSPAGHPRAKVTDVVSGLY